MIWLFIKTFVVDHLKEKRTSTQIGDIIRNLILQFCNEKTCYMILNECTQQPGVNFINISATFTYDSVFVAFMCIQFGCVIFLAKGNQRKSCL